MRKCLIMLTLLVVTLLIAALTERKHETRMVDGFAINGHVAEDIAFEQARQKPHEVIKEK